MLTLNENNEDIYIIHTIANTSNDKVANYF